MNEDEVEALATKITARIQVEPPAKKWLQWALIIGGVAGMLTGAGSLVFQTKASADDHEKEPTAHQQRITVLEKTQNEHKTMLRSFEHNIIRIGEHLKVKDLKTNGQ